MEDLDNQISPSDTMEVKGEPRSSETVLEAIRQAKKTFETYNNFCKRVDEILSAKQTLLGSTTANGWTDQEYDLFWASMEILKPAIYAKPPRIVVSTRFKDGNSTDKTVAELMERVLNSEFERSDIDQVMLDLRDDLAITNRGVDWVTYESDDGKKVCIEHLDRYDFLHEPARKWTEVSWVARCAYMTRKQMADRFRDKSGQAYEDAGFTVSREDRDNGAADDSMKAEVWEVWSKADDRVYWVSENVKVFLDEDKPHLNLDRGFPCPRPAYGTKQRRSLIPVPDYARYEGLLDQINEATRKIYDLLEQVRAFGLIPGGGDIGNAIQAALNNSETATFQLIPVPGAQFGAASAGGMVAWWPIDMIATTIQGLITARQQLFADFDQLSGISDIMRGETAAEETLGAQRLKGQYGSVRIKDKTDEIIRVARDTACIAGEIICDNFDQKTLLEISQMQIPTKSEVQSKIKEVEKSAKGDLEKLGEQAEEMANQAVEKAQQSGQPIDPQMQQEAQQQLQEQQQAIIAKYAPILDSLRRTVVIEDVMKVIKDKRTRGLIIDIETDSTVMVDEMAEKQARAEFLQAFTGASAAVQPLLMAGEAGAKLAGALLKFSMQPFNANRELDSLIDDFVEKAPELAAQQGQADDGSAELAAAQNKLAEAEGIKAQAAMASVQAKAAQSEADNQRKMAELQQKAQNDQQKAQADNDKLRLQLAQMQEDAATKAALTEAQINKLTADTAKILASIGLDERKQQLSEYTAAENAQQKQVDTALALNSENRADRGEERADRQQDFSEQSTDRQMTLAERQEMSKETE
jgi:hypothetical protein